MKKIKQCFHFSSQQVFKFLLAVFCSLITTFFTGINCLKIFSKLQQHLSSKHLVNKLFINHDNLYVLGCLLFLLICLFIILLFYI